MRLQSHSFRNSFSNDFESPRSSSPTRNRVSRSQTLPIQALRSDVEDVRFGYTSVITNEVQSGFSAADWSSNFNVYLKLFGHLLTFILDLQAARSAKRAK